MPLIYRLERVRESRLIDARRRQGFPAKRRPLAQNSPETPHQGIDPARMAENRQSEAPGKPGWSASGIESQDTSLPGIIGELGNGFGNGPLFKIGEPLPSFLAAVVGNGLETGFAASNRFQVGLETVFIFMRPLPTRAGGL